MTYKLTIESSPPAPAPTAAGGDVSSLEKNMPLRLSLGKRGLLKSRSIEA